MGEPAGIAERGGAMCAAGVPARTLVVAGAAHALHDGYTDLIYVMLPVWQAEFALGYGMLAALRGLYAGAMALLQVPAGHLAQRWGARAVLVVGTVLAALGYALAGASTGLVGLAIALVISGAGSSSQHPIASAAVARAYGSAARGPLGTYNFSGDLGKAAIPALTSLLIATLSWRHSLWVLALLGWVAALGIARYLPVLAATATASAEAPPAMAGRGRGGFALLLVIGMFDTSVRMGLLTFLPFLLQSKGASLPTIGLALSLVFMGGAAGKFLCGWLGERLGVLWTVLLTEAGTAALILVVLLVPLTASLLLLPLLGLMLNGTSSVLYGTVPEVAPSHRPERAFALFYTGNIGSGAFAPVLFGCLGDAAGPRVAIMATAATALVILPLAFALQRHLAPLQSARA